MTTRLVLGTLGAVLFVAGLAVVSLSGGATGSIYAAGLLTSLTVTLLYGGYRATTLFEDGSTVDLPVVESARTVSTIDDRLDADLDSLSDLPVSEAATIRESIHDRLREAAVSAVRRREGITEAAARERVESGEWTDDGDVGEFLAGSLDDTRRFESRVRESVDTIAAYLGVDDGGSASSTDSFLADVPTTVSEAIERRVERTDRLQGLLAVVLLPVALGLAVGSASVVLASSVGLALLAAREVVDIPDPEIEVVRELSSPDPDPGERVAVSVTIRNTGDSRLSDLRIVDGVPAPLAVVEGAARHGTSLAPGASDTFRYEVRADRGTFSFREAHVRVRDILGVRECTTTVATETTIQCRPSLATPEDVPLRDATDPYPGRVSTAANGEGLEFYSTREYRPEDDVSRIDWNRYAATGELTTVEFRKEQIVRVLLLIDTREPAHVRVDGGRNAIQHCLDAAEMVFSATRYRFRSK